jgi:GntR family transcriptional repressor for pyruvate dehydrogenase complex
MAANSASLTDTLFCKLEQKIVSGEMPPGARFPTQKDLADTENVSRTVVREAVARLAARGLVTTRQGSGVYVSLTAQYRAFQVTQDELGDVSDIMRLLEMRAALETEIAALAAVRRTAEDIADLRRVLRVLEETEDDPESAAFNDRLFHLAIAKAARNDYFVRIIDFLGIRLVPPRSLFLRDQPHEAHLDYARKVQGEHEAILDAIVRMDSAKAREAARHHMEESLARHSELGDAADRSRRLVPGSPSPS